jgi:hypothetical protein
MVCERFAVQRLVMDIEQLYQALLQRHHARSPAFLTTGKQGTRSIP